MVGEPEFSLFIRQRVCSRAEIKVDLDRILKAYITTATSLDLTLCKDIAEDAVKRLCGTCCRRSIGRVRYARGETPGKGRHRLSVSEIYHICGVRLSVPSR